MEKKHRPIADQKSLTIDQFKTMDRKAINEYFLPIELMMENAGSHLARFIAMVANRESKILVGAGTGNNGGGGLVAARKLAGWGYHVNIDLPDSNLMQLPASQLRRALAFGASANSVDRPDIFVDAYFGFSQRLPLPKIYMDTLHRPEISNAIKVSLDLPSGFDKVTLKSLFTPDSILTLAALKSELIQSDIGSEIYVADIGIPVQLYRELGITQPDFGESGIVKFINKPS